MSKKELLTESPTHFEGQHNSVPFVLSRGNLVFGRTGQKIMKLKKELFGVIKSKGFVFKRDIINDPGKNISGIISYKDRIISFWHDVGVREDSHNSVFKIIKTILHVFPDYHIRFVEFYDPKDWMLRSEQTLISSYIKNAREHWNQAHRLDSYGFIGDEGVVSREEHSHQSLNA